MKEKRELKKKIVGFVNTWDEVIDLKLAEYNLDEKEKIEYQNKNSKIVEEDPSSFFSYIYNWLEVTDDGKIAPHRSRRKTQRGNGRLRKNIYPIAADIVDYFCEYPTGKYKDEESIERSVGRALIDLRENLKIVYASDNTYRPKTIEYHRKTLMGKFTDYTPIDEKKFFSVSKNTYVIYFMGNVLDKEKDFLKGFIGERDLFDIFQLDSKVVVLIKGSAEKTVKVGKALRELIKYTYNNQESKRLSVETSDIDFNPTAP